MGRVTGDEPPPRIDPACYTKAEAMHQIKPLLGNLLCRCGAVSLYLDYQLWLPHFNWWHPFTWLVYLYALGVHGLVNRAEIHREMFVPRSKRIYTYRKAPRGPVRSTAKSRQTKQNR